MTLFCIISILVLLTHIVLSKPTSCKTVVEDGEDQEDVIDTGKDDEEPEEVVFDAGEDNEEH